MNTPYDTICQRLIDGPDKTEAEAAALAQAAFQAWSPAESERRLAEREAEFHAGLRNRQLGRWVCLVVVSASAGAVIGLGWSLLIRMGVLH